MRLFSRLGLLIYLLLFIIGCDENNPNNIYLINSIFIVFSNKYRLINVRIYFLIKDNY